MRAALDRVRRPFERDDGHAPSRSPSISCTRESTVPVIASTAEASMSATVPSTPRTRPACFSRPQPRSALVGRSRCLLCKRLAAGRIRDVRESRRMHRDGGTPGARRRGRPRTPAQPQALVANSDRHPIPRQACLGRRGHRSPASLGCLRKFGRAHAFSPRIVGQARLPLNLRAVIGRVADAAHDVAMGSSPPRYRHRLSRARGSAVAHESRHREPDARRGR